MDKPTVHAIAIYGRCEWDGVSIIKMVIRRHIRHYPFEHLDLFRVMEKTTHFYRSPKSDWISFG